MRQLKKLGMQETEQIYNIHLVKDFRQSEVKPLKKILGGMQEGKYETYSFTEGEELLGYAYFIKSTVSDTFLLDYFAVVQGKRSKGVGSAFLKELMNMVSERGGHLILEVENPKYEREPEQRAYMIKRIGFYKKNGLNLSGVSCTFYGNEYRIFYGGESVIANEEIQSKTSIVYNDFFGKEFINMHCKFHPINNYEY